MRQFLNKDPILSFASLLAILQIGILAAYFITLDNGFDFSGHVIGRDFANMYLGGSLIGQGQIDVLFANGEYWQAMRDWLAADYPIHNWSYPPTMFLGAEQLAKLPYMAAYLVWTLGGMVFLALALRSLGFSWLWSFLVILSPAGMWNILAGQNAYFISGFLVFSIGYSWENKKIPAGIFWAFATVKPHLGLLAAPLLLGKKRFGVIISGAIALGVLLAIVLLRYGVEPWQSFFTITMAHQRIVLENWDGLVEILVPTAFMQGRLLGLPLALSYGLHGLVAIVGVGLLIRAWPRANADKRHWITWFALGTYLLLPYSFVYDFILFHVVLVMWRKDLWGFFQVKNPEIANGVWIFLWLSPLILGAIAMIVKIQIMPAVLLWLLWRFGNKSQSIA